MGKKFSGSLLEDQDGGKIHCDRAGQTNDADHREHATEQNSLHLNFFGRIHGKLCWLADAWLGLSQQNTQASEKFQVLAERQKMNAVAGLGRRQAWAKLPVGDFCVSHCTTTFLARVLNFSPLAGTTVMET